jgi:peptidoglycan/xylan/chitin deacetylase (PgdA/CDA1 family)
MTDRSEGIARRASDNRFRSHRTALIEALRSLLGPRSVPEPLANADGAAALAAALWTAPRWLVPRLAARSPRCLYSVATREQAVALTLDDGPDRAHTPEILRLLHEYGARATFFLISERVPCSEEIVASAVAQGNEIGNHLTRDEPSFRLPPDTFTAAVREAGSVLGRFGEVRWLRPASGWYTDTHYDRYDRARGVSLRPRFHLPL